MRKKGHRKIKFERKKNKQARQKQKHLKERRHKKPKNLYSKAKEFMLGETIMLPASAASPC